MVTVVVCDDDPFLRQSVTELCEAAGLTVVAETDRGADAVELVKRFDVDVLVLDLAMADGSGERTLEALRDLEAQPVVIVLTAYAEDPDRLVRLGRPRGDREAELLAAGVRARTARHHRRPDAPQPR